MIDLIVPGSECYLCIKSALLSVVDVGVELFVFLFFVLCFLGDIQIGMMEKKGQLEVEVIRARGLVQKPGSKSLPGKSPTWLKPPQTN